MVKKNDPTRNAPDEINIYLSNLDNEKRECLEKIREMIREYIPEVRERVSYGIPIFRLDKDLIGISATKSYCSLHTMSPMLIEKLKEHLKPYEISGATIHFTVNNPLDKDIIKLILFERANEI